MVHKINFKIVLLIASFLVTIISAYGQVGINTETPTSTLDVDGNLRVRSTPISSSTTDDILVMNDSGYVKKSIVSNSYFRGYLGSDFSSGTTNSAIYKITGFTIVDQPTDEFDTSDNTFTPAYSGLYNIVLTLTSTIIADINANNIVYGLTDSETGKWVMRFSVPVTYAKDVGQNSTSGVVNSFSGAVMLTKGKKYYFGVTGNVKLLSNPSGNTGSGIGSYLAIELIKTY